MLSIRCNKLSTSIHLVKILLVHVARNEFDLLWRSGFPTLVLPNNNGNCSLGKMLSALAHMSKRNRKQVHTFLSLFISKALRFLYKSVRVQVYMEDLTYTMWR